MKLTEKDKNLLLILAVIAAFCLPLVLLVQPAMNKCEALTREISELQSRKSYLDQIVAAGSTYQEEAENIAVKKEELMNRFPSDIPQEASLLFMDNTEKKLPISLYQVGFGEDVAMQMTSAPTQEAIDQVEADTGDVTDDSVYADTTSQTAVTSGLTGISTSTDFSYTAGYEEFKEFLDYIENYNDRMVITSLTASYAMDMNQVNGNFTLIQYALKGEDRNPVSFLEPEMIQGTNNIFTQASGVFNEETNQSAQFFLMLNQPDADDEAFIMGQMSDVAEKTYLVNDENKLQKAAIEFEGTDGEYTAYYSVGKEKTVKEGIPFTADGQIGFEILSSERADDKDKVSVQVDIVNNTDTIVYLSVQNDDEENPRVTIKGKTGDIFTK
ncbi:hypothetical protein [Suilimivivens sp.]|uniref:hypothetical protein n=1 Tax=Suilimivivens sp. TaxID=2981669 RepID=UPI0030790D21